MEFTNEKLGCTFTLPEPFRIRDVEAYEGARDTARDAGAKFAPTINWLGAAGVIDEWECDILPDHEVLTAEALADVHGEVMQLVFWVASTVAVYVMGELFISKN